MQMPRELSDGDGTVLQVHRAWPRQGGRLTFEGREPESGRVRAGSIDAEGRAWVVPFAEDRALPGLKPAAVAGELLVHRFKRRAVVRSGGKFRKFIAGDKALAIASAHSAVASALAGSGLEAPDVVAVDTHSVTLSTVPGVSLHQLGRTVSPNHEGTQEALSSPSGSASLNQWASAWALWAHYWPRFVAAPYGGGTGPALRCYSAEEEAGTVEHWVSLAASFDALRVPENRLRSASRLVTRSLISGTSPAQLAHRDLHDKQLLIDTAAGSVGIIDCDTLAIAEPALDLANLSVHLDLRVAQGLLSAPAAELGKQHIAGAAEALHVPDSRLEAYASATALRLACLYAFRPPYRDMAREWFSEVEYRLKWRSSPAVAPLERRPAGR